MESPMKRERNDFTGDNSDDAGASSKRQRIVPQELEVEDDVYILPYSGELRESQPYIQVKQKMKMNYEEFKEALEKSTRTEEEIKILLEYVQSCVLSVEGRFQLKDKLNVAFSQADFAQVAPYFSGLNPTADSEKDAGFRPCVIHPMRVPDSLFRDILRHMDSKFNQYGWPWEHQNETMRNYCITEIISPLLDVFKGVFIDKAEVLLESGVTKRRGRVEHRWIAFSSICVEYQELKFDQAIGKEKLKVMAHMVLESDACAFENKRKGFCIPIIGILGAYEFIQALIYHPHKRVFYLSKPIPGFPGYEIDVDVLICNIRRIVDHVFGLLVSAYINALDAFIQRSELLMNKEKVTRESTAHWQEASLLAKKALKLGREAAWTIRHDARKLYREGLLKERIADAVNMSEEALQSLRESVKKSPKSFPKPSLHERYVQDEEEFHEKEALRGW